MENRPIQSESLGQYQSLFEAAIERSKQDEFVGRIWNADASLWKSDDQHQKLIRRSLGWLWSPNWVWGKHYALEEFAREIRDLGFAHAVLLGMGGSSLCPEVFRRTFGKRDGFPDLLVLDTTDPDTIADLEARIDLANTLFIVSSKSGTTIEPLSFYKYFFDRVQSIKDDRAGENFIAITDPYTLMERIAGEANFRHAFFNMAGIGGRYSALSYFGIVPAAIMGLEVEELIPRGFLHYGSEGVRLGCALGALANAGCDKLTLVTSPDISSIGLWIEQLVAESTGKEGKGIIPVAGEPLGPPEVYGADRGFVAISVGELKGAADDRLRALEAAGRPIIRRVLKSPFDLAAEFFIWEFATAVAGALLEINPFDQPNVQESKDNTNSLLEEFKQNGALPEQVLNASDDGLKIYGAKTEAATTAEIISEHLATVKAGDYIALLAYIQETDEHEELLQAIRLRLRDRFHVATTTGYGPRFLHSTGQLHKGGPDSGVFIQLTCDAKVDLPIPGEPYTFGILRQAQALGDFSALEKHGRRAIRIHLGSDVAAGLQKLLQIL